MPLTDEHKDELFHRLESAGWQWEEEIIYAPHESIWFQREEPWVGDLDEFLSRMWGRLKRIRNNDMDEEAQRDTAQLVEVLRGLVRDTAPSPLIDHVVGCIVGGAIGDAMGGPVEGLRKVTEEQLQGPWKLSDDTTLTLASCEAVREVGGTY